MARNNPKPTEKPDFIPDDTTNIETPSGSVKTNGWTFGIKPPAEYFNWFWNLLSRFTDYFGAQVEDWIVIDSDVDEGDYATIQAYIADSPAAGDRVLVKVDQTITATLTIPDGITLKILDGVIFELPNAIPASGAAINIGSNIKTSGINLDITNTGPGGQQVGIVLDDNNSIVDANIENSGTQTLVNAFRFSAGTQGNRVSGIVSNAGSGSILGMVSDVAFSPSNIWSVIDDENELLFSSILTGDSTNTLTNKTIDGDDNTISNLAHGFEVDNPTVAHGATGAVVGTTNAQTLSSKTLGTGTIVALGSDANGDIYYRDAGILKRLAIGATDTYLRVIAGIPSWSNIGAFSGGVKTDGVNTLITKVVQIGDWNMDTTDTVSVAHGINVQNIRSVDAMIRNDASTNFTPITWKQDVSNDGVEGGVGITDSTNVILTRTLSGSFDNVNYDSTSFNRGWITITYIA